MPPRRLRGGGSSPTKEGREKISLHYYWGETCPRREEANDRAALEEDRIERRSKETGGGRGKRLSHNLLWEKRGRSNDVQRIASPVRGADRKGRLEGGEEKKNVVFRALS